MVLASRDMLQLACSMGSASSCQLADVRLRSGIASHISGQERLQMRCRVPLPLQRSAYTVNCTACRPAGVLRCASGALA